MNQNLYSIDKLVQFGMELSIAQQMVSSMNKAMNDMEYPGCKMKKEPSSSFFVAMDSKPAGPFSEQELLALIKTGKVNKDSLVWKQGMQSWKKVEDVPEVLRLIALTPPPLPEESK